jgi:hypothetical protein
MAGSEEVKEDGVDESASWWQRRNKRKESKG